MLSRQEYNDRISNSEDFWNQLTRRLLHTKVGLFVGLSGDDPTIGPALTRVYKETGPGRQIGFWLLTDTPDKEDKARALRRLGVVPVVLPDYNDYAAFILEICQRAA